MNTFRPTYRKLTAPETRLVDNIKSKAEEMEALLRLAGPNREASLAQTKLEECVMWAVKGITG